MCMLAVLSKQIQNIVMLLKKSFGNLHKEDGFGH